MNHRNVSGDIPYWFELTSNYACVQRGSWQYGDSNVAGSADWVDDECKYFTTSLDFPQRTTLVLLCIFGVG